MAIGGYTSAILAVHYGVPTLVGLVAGACASALVAAVLGLVCGRLRGMYLAIVTLAFGILVEALANGLNITGGPSGIAGIPPFSVAGYSFDTDTRMFYLVWVLVAVALVLSVNLVRSNRGRILRAMHGDQVGHGRSACTSPGPRSPCSSSARAWPRSPGASTPATSVICPPIRSGARNR